MSGLCRPAPRHSATWSDPDEGVKRKNVKRKASTVAFTRFTFHVFYVLVRPPTCQHSRLSGHTRRAGIEPAASRFGVGRSAVGTSGAVVLLQCAGRDSNPRRPMASGSTGRRNCRSATCAFCQSTEEGSPPRRLGQGGDELRGSLQSAWKGSNLRPRVPETRALPTALHAENSVMSEE